MIDIDLIGGWRDGDDLPKIVLYNMIGVVGTSRDLVVLFGTRVLYFMSVQVVFGFKVTQYYRLVGVEIFPCPVDLLQGTVEG